MITTDKFSYPQSRKKRCPTPYLLVGGVASVDILSGVLVHQLDGASLKELLDGTTGKGAVDLEALGDSGRGHQLESGSLLHHAVVGVLVEAHHVVELFADLALGPFLLLGRSTGLALGEEVLEVLLGVGFARALNVLLLWWLRGART